MLKRTTYNKLTCHSPYRLVLQPRLIQMVLGLSTLVVASEASAGCNANQIAAIGGLLLSSSYISSPYYNEGNSYDYNNDDYNNAPCPSDIVSITPDQVFGMGSMATRVNGGKLSLPSNYFNLNQGKHQGGGAGDFDFPALNFWSKIDSDFGSHDTTSTQSGFEYDKQHFVFGADYRIKDNWVAGGSFAYSHNTAHFDASRGETLNDNYTGMLYTSYYITDAAHVEATASYGGFSYETSRNINFGGNSSIAKAKPEGGQYAFTWGGGYDFNFDALTVAPYARGEYSNLDIDSYSENGSPFAVRFGKQNIESLISTLGIQSSYAISLPWGVLIPQIRGEWHHQFLDSQRQVQASFVAFPGSSFVMNSGGPSRDYFTVGGEISAILPGGISAFLSYESLQGYSSINNNKFILGARMEF